MGYIIMTIAVFLVATLVAEQRKSTVGLLLTKPVASSGFIVLALWCGALSSGYGRWILVGLVFSWFGDVFLISRDLRFFRAGLVSFLLGHVAYVVAFFVFGADLTRSGMALVPLAVVAVFVFRWLRPGLGKMAGPVLAYIVVISLMVAAAMATLGPDGQWLRVGGAVVFYLSDLFVARDRFHTNGFENRMFGLPLYYSGQVALACSALYPA